MNEKPKKPTQPLPNTGNKSSGIAAPAPAVTTNQTYPDPM